MVLVRLKDIIEGMEFQSDEMTAYLHRPTGRVLTVSDEAFTAAEGDDDDWVEPEELSEAKNILAAGDEYVALPDRFEIDEYGMMQRFAGSILYAQQQDELSAALRGSGAFRRFKDTIHRLRLADEWYAFRDRSYEEVARAWCEAHNITLDTRADA
jgi:hypothetical protein